MIRRRTVGDPTTGVRKVHQGEVATVGGNRRIRYPDGAVRKGTHASIAVSAASRYLIACRVPDQTGEKGKEVK